MTPIHELLNRIQWDKAFAEGEFQIAYHDRFEKPLVKVALQEITFDKDDRFAFSLLDSEGRVHQVPFHRIREVYRDGELIWHREG